MARMIAFCGLICSDCPAYQSTQANDPDALEQVLAQWRGEYSAPYLVVRDIICDGCQAKDGRLNGYCLHCKIRPCAITRGILNCAYCNEYPCDKLEHILAICDRQKGFFGFANRARATLGHIRAELMQ